MTLRHRLGAVLIAGCLLPAAVPSGAAAQPAAAQPAAAQAEAAAAGDAILKLGACLAAQGEGDLLLLIDRSGSLDETDPGAVRVQAANYLLSGLATYADDVEVELDVAVSGFDAEYERTVDWQRLTTSSLPVFTRGVDAYADRDTGFDTDYANALSGVRDDLRSRQRGTDERRCQAQVWFSDGRFDIDTRRGADAVERHGDSKPYAPGIRLTDEAGTAAAEAAGQQSLCRSGGLVDQLRATGALTFGVGLGTRADDFALMSSIASGSGGPQCGKSTTEVVGDFRLAQDVDALIFALDAFSEPGTKTLDRTTGVCPMTACATEAHSFVLDRSIRAVHVLAGADAPGIDVLLRDPSGGPDTRFRYVEGEPVLPQRIAGQDVTASWVSDKTLQIDLGRRSDDGWFGQWSVIFVDPTGTADDAVARTQLRITGDLLPALAGEAPVLRSGEQPRIQLGVASEETSQPVPATALLGTARLSASLVSSDGQQRSVLPPTAPADLGAGTTLDLADVPPGQATLTLVLSIQTRGIPATGGRAAIPGTQLADRQVDLPLTVLPPLGFPTVAGRVDFGRVEGAGPFDSSVTVNGPGCVWVMASTLDASPDGVPGAAVTSSASSADTCLNVVEGQTAELPVSLSVDGQGNGTASGRVEVSLAPQDATERALTATVAFVADLQRPVDAGKKLAIFFVALVLGIGLPIAFLYLAKRWTSKIAGRALAVGQVDVQLEGDQVLRDGRAFTFSSKDLAFLSLPNGGARRLHAAGLDLRSRTGWSPTSPGYTEAYSAGDVVVGPQGRARLPLTVHGSWVGLLRQTDLDDVRVALLLPATGISADVCARIARDVRDRLPDLARRIRSEAGSLEPPAGQAPGWGGGGAPAAEAVPSTWGAAPASASVTTWGSAPAPPPPRRPSSDGEWGSSGSSTPWGGSPSA